VWIGSGVFLSVYVLCKSPLGSCLNGRLDVLAV